jgi:Na+/alanine symporter
MGFFLHLELSDERNVGNRSSQNTWLWSTPLVVLCLERAFIFPYELVLIQLRLVKDMASQLFRRKSIRIRRFLLFQ